MSAQKVCRYADRFGGTRRCAARLNPGLVSAACSRPAPPVGQSPAEHSDRPPAADGREGLDVFPAAQTRELLLPASRHREALASDTLLINRRRYILHPRGVKFTSASVAGDSPTNAELETAANWVRVFETKNVRIVAIEHNN